MAARVHAHLPRRLAEHLAVTLAGAQVIDAGATGWMAAAEAAAADPDCVAFVGPLLSWQVAETAPLLNQADIAQLAVAATYSGLTRDEPGAEDGMPASLGPTGRRTLFRLVPRDRLVCRALLAAERGPHRLVSDGTPYGDQIAAQLRMEGLQEDDAAESVIYAGLAPGLPAGARLAFEGAIGPEADPELRFYLAQRPGDGWADEEVVDFLPQVNEAALLLTGSLLAGGPTREGVLEALRACGRFDEHGDTSERRVGVWRWDADRLRGVGTAQIPTDAPEVPRSAP